MKYQKLDRRYRLCKLGLATHMAKLTPAQFIAARGHMERAFGYGAQDHFVNPYLSFIERRRDWFYTYQRASTGTISHDEFRIYFRREEQATYLALTLTL
jgi:hypothetical protein